MHACGFAFRNPTAEGVAGELSAEDLASVDVTLSPVCLGDVDCVFVQPGATNRLARPSADTETDTKERAGIGGSRITISLPRREYCAILSGSEAPIYF